MGRSKKANLRQTSNSLLHYHTINKAQALKLKKSQIALSNSKPLDILSPQSISQLMQHHVNKIEAEQIIDVYKLFQDFHVALEFLEIYMDTKIFNKIVGEEELLITTEFISMLDNLNIIHKQLLLDKNYMNFFDQKSTFLLLRANFTIYTFQFLHIKKTHYTSIATQKFSSLSKKEKDNLLILDTVKKQSILSLKQLFFHFMKEVEFTYQGEKYQINNGNIEKSAEKAYMFFLYLVQNSKKNKIFQLENLDLKSYKLLLENLDFISEEFYLVDHIIPKFRQNGIPNLISKFPIKNEMENYKIIHDKYISSYENEVSIEKKARIKKLIINFYNNSHIEFTKLIDIFSELLLNNIQIIEKQYEINEAMTRELNETLNVFIEICNLYKTNFNNFLQFNSHLNSKDVLNQQFSLGNIHLIIRDLILKLENINLSTESKNERDYKYIICKFISSMDDLQNCCNFYPFSNHYNLYNENSPVNYYLQMYFVALDERLRLFKLDGKTYNLMDDNEANLQNNDDNKSPNIKAIDMLLEEKVQIYSQLTQEQNKGDYNYQYHYEQLTVVKMIYFLFLSHIKEENEYTSKKQLLVSDIIGMLNNIADFYILQGKIVEAYNIFYTIKLQFSSYAQYQDIKEKVDNSLARLKEIYVSLKLNEFHFPTPLNLLTSPNNLSNDVLNYSIKSDDIEKDYYSFISAISQKQHDLKPSQFYSPNTLSAITIVTNTRETKIQFIHALLGKDIPYNAINPLLLYKIRSLSEPEPTKYLHNLLFPLITRFYINLSQNKFIPDYGLSSDNKEIQQEQRAIKFNAYDFMYMIFIALKNYGHTALSDRLLEDSIQYLYDNLATSKPIIVFKKSDIKQTLLDSNIIFISDIFESFFVRDFKFNLDHPTINIAEMINHDLRFYSGHEIEQISRIYRDLYLTITLTNLDFHNNNNILLLFKKTYFKTIMLNIANISSVIQNQKNKVNISDFIKINIILIHLIYDIRVSIVEYLKNHKLNVKDLDSIKKYHEELTLISLKCFINIEEILKTNTDIRIFYNTTHYKKYENEKNIIKKNYTLEALDEIYSKFLNIDNNTLLLETDIVIKALTNDPQYLQVVLNDLQNKITNTIHFINIMGFLTDDKSLYNQACNKLDDNVSYKYMKDSAFTKVKIYQLLNFFINNEGKEETIDKIFEYITHISTYNSNNVLLSPNNYIYLLQHLVNNLDQNTKINYDKYIPKLYETIIHLFCLGINNHKFNSKLINSFFFFVYSNKENIIETQILINDIINLLNNINIAYKNISDDKSPTKEYQNNVDDITELLQTKFKYLYRYQMLFNILYLHLYELKQLDILIPISEEITKSLENIHKDKIDAYQKLSKKNRNNGLTTEKKYEYALELLEMPLHNSLMISLNIFIFQMLKKTNFKDNILVSFYINFLLSVNLNITAIKIKPEDQEIKELYQDTKNLYLSSLQELFDILLQQKTNALPMYDNIANIPNYKELNKLINQKFNDHKQLIYASNLYKIISTLLSHYKDLSVFNNDKKEQDLMDRLIININKKISQLEYSNKTDKQQKRRIKNTIKATDANNIEYPIIEEIAEEEQLELKTEDLLEPEIQLPERSAKPKLPAPKTVPAKDSTTHYEYKVATQELDNQQQVSTSAPNTQNNQEQQSNSPISTLKAKNLVENTAVDPKKPIDDKFPELQSSKVMEKSITKSNDSKKQIYILKRSNARPIEQKTKQELASPKDTDPQTINRVNSLEIAPQSSVSPPKIPKLGIAIKYDKFKLGTQANSGELKRENSLEIEPQSSNFHTIKSGINMNKVQPDINARRQTRNKWLENLVNNRNNNNPIKPKNRDSSPQSSVSPPKIPKLGITITYDSFILDENDTNYKIKQSIREKLLLLEATFISNLKQGLDNNDYFLEIYKNNISTLIDLISNNKINEEYLHEINKRLEEISQLQRNACFNFSQMFNKIQILLNPIIVINKLIEIKLLKEFDYGIFQSLLTINHAKHLDCNTLFTKIIYIINVYNSFSNNEKTQTYYQEFLQALKDLQSSTFVNFNDNIDKIYQMSSQLEYILFSNKAYLSNKISVVFSNNSNDDDINIHNLLQNKINNLDNNTVKAINILYHITFIHNFLQRYRPIEQSIDLYNNLKECFIYEIKYLPDISENLCNKLYKFMEDLKKSQYLIIQQLENDSIMINEGQRKEIAPDKMLFADRLEIKLQNKERALSP